jgi:hypothetical protein
VGREISIASPGIKPLTAYPEPVTFAHVGSLNWQQIISTVKKTKPDYLVLMAFIAGFFILR